MAMTAQELADSVMSDFKALEGTWQLQIRHNSILTGKFIPVPVPAMAMLKRYRESRGLSSYPDASEMDVPVVARQRSERKVNACPPSLDNEIQANQAYALSASDRFSPSISLK